MERGVVLGVLARLHLKRQGPSFPPPKKKTKKKQTDPYAHTFWLTTTKFSMCGGGAGFGGSAMPPITEVSPMQHP